MARRKKCKTIQSTTGFSNPTDLAFEEFTNILISLIRDIKTVVLPNINWNKGVIGTLCFSLNAGNQNIPNRRKLLDLHFPHHPPTYSSSPSLTGA